MGLKSLMQYLQKPVSDTPDTSAVSVPYQRKAPIHAGCTPDTPDTSRFVDTPAIVQIGLLGEAVNDSAPEPPPDPDRWCWPHSDAMTGAEIDTFTGRLVVFMAKGLTANESEALADKLVIRDRDGDDRRVCLECSHLSGWAGRRQCRGLQHAGMGGPLVSAGEIATLQRCNGFKAAS